MTELIIKAPLAGWALPLAEVDDPVFRDRMMGDGMAIDPLEAVVRSPADAEVIAIAPTGHSVTLRCDNGAELLIHVGLETVALNGDGFEVRTQAGARVQAGDELIAFDLETLARRAKSLVTPIVLISEGFTLRVIAQDAVRGGDPIMALEGRGIASGASGAANTVDIQTTVQLPQGIHARPAAKIAMALKAYTADVRLLAGDREANARSVGAMLALAVKRGDTISIRGSGADAERAAAAVRDLIESGMGEAESPSPIVPAPSPAAGTGPRFRGICAAPGSAVGPVVQLRPAQWDVPPDGAGKEVERRALMSAIDALRRELTSDGSQADEGVTLAHLAILDDPELAAGAFREIDEGRSAAWAWREATAGLAASIRNTGDAFLTERVDDLIDVERRLIAKLLGKPAVDVRRLPSNALVVASNLLPSEYMALDTARLGGVVNAGGGPTSHVAIMAASAGVPMMVAAGDGILAVREGSVAVLDADAGIFDAEPSAELTAEVARSVTAKAAAREEQARAALSDCFMADGTRIEVFANLGSLEDARQAVGLGAEGCGLLRTEFLFLDRSTAPTEEEQREVYAGVAEALKGRPLIVRTLDIGGDKPVPYLDVIPEENPALGRRGVRLSLARPEIMATQLRAILAAVPATQCRIMVPMIVDVEELRAVRALLRDAASAVGAGAEVPLGVMIETPSAALLAESIAAEADFLSIGTNDLSQYALAVDRGNPAVAAMVDALHPSVLRLIESASQGAAKHGRLLAVCGGLASDPKAAGMLIGLGVTELSAVPAAVPAVKAAVRELRMEDCRRLARQALTLGTAREVRALLSGEQ